MERALIIVLAILILGLMVQRIRGEAFAINQTSPVVSGVDGRKYRVHEQHLGSRAAADVMARLNGRVVSLLRALRGKYPSNSVRGRSVERLLTRYNPDNLAENSPNDPNGDTAYSLDKGAVVAICLRDRAGSGGLHDIDTLTFVALHEMSHIAIDYVEHPPEFWATFRWLLEEAEVAGVYTSPDFARTPRPYCGKTIDYNPRYDPRVRAA